jgi:hypothetical protein
VYLYVYSLIVAMQDLSKNVATAMYANTTILKLLDVLFSMWSVLYETKIGD